MHTKFTPGEMTAERRGHREAVPSIQERARERTTQLAEATITAMAKDFEYWRSRPEATTAPEWMRLIADRPSVATRSQPRRPISSRIHWPPPPDPDCAAILAAPFASASPEPADDGSLPLMYAVGDAAQGRIELVAAAFGAEDVSAVTTVPGFSHANGMNVQRANGGLVIRGSVPENTTTSLNVFAPVRVRGNALLVKSDIHNRLDLASAVMLVSATAYTSSYYGDKSDGLEPFALLYAPSGPFLGLGGPVDFFDALSIDIPAQAGDVLEVAVEALLIVAVNAGSELLVAGGFSRSGIYSTGVGDSNDGIEIGAVQLSAC